MNYYDRQGRRISRDEWASSIQHVETMRHVARDELPDGVVVSTVWLGLDHQFGEGPPLIFETMVFGGSMDEYQERYSTEAEAQLGHARVLAAVKGEA